MEDILALVPSWIWLALGGVAAGILAYFRGKAIGANNTRTEIAAQQAEGDRLNRRIGDEEARRAIDVDDPLAELRRQDTRR